MAIFDIFQKIKQIPMQDIARRYLPGDLRRVGSRWVALCPFHAEKTPSFYVFQDGWKCFGCGAGGDGVALVAALNGLRPIEAARLVMSDFGLSTDTTGPDQVTLRRLEAAREKAARQKAEEEAIRQGVALLNRVAGRIVAGIASLGDAEALAWALHAQPQLEALALALLAKDPEERTAAMTGAWGWVG